MPPEHTTTKPASRSHMVQSWQNTFDAPPPRGMSQPIIRHFLEFEHQVKRHGGLDRKTKQAIARLQKADPSNAATKHRPCNNSKLAVGSQLMREWNGVTNVVEVLEVGFQWQGKHYRSLSAIAQAITGAHWSGPRFFGLGVAKHV